MRGPQHLNIHRFFHNQISVGTFKKLKQHLKIHISFIVLSLGQPLRPLWVTRTLGQKDWWEMLAHWLPLHGATVLKWRDLATPISQCLEQRVCPWWVFPFFFGFVCFWSLISSSVSYGLTWISSWSRVFQIMRRVRWWGKGGNLADKTYGLHDHLLPHIPKMQI